MSSERTNPPTMSTAIMYHNEARFPSNHPFSRQPDRANIGLDKYKLIPGQCFDSMAGSAARSSKLYTQPRGYTHTGAHMGVNYQVPKLDPNWTRPVYGNSKPQVLSYTMSRSNLLTRF